ncbi:MAG: hypothetical protein COT17_01040 [Elusimicrobia bacterium CG08_land_8_20_14_0_20_51_18]|nr:MAG: hypothetical protein COT17_01040 [Elusimicrobia bacterium CG08_land_8_20_14_0_20_51_18]
MSVKKKRNSSEPGFFSKRYGYAGLFEKIPYVIYYLQLRPSKKLLYVNPALFEMTGYTREEACLAGGEFFEKIRHPGDAAKYPVLPGPAAGKENLKMRWFRKDGTVIWVETIVVPVSDGTGKLVAVQGVVRDITAENAYREEIDRYTKELIIFSNVDYVFLKFKDESVYQKILEILLDITRSRSGFMGFLDAGGDIKIRAATNDMRRLPGFSGRIRSGECGKSKAIWARSLAAGKLLFSNKKTFVAFGGRGPANAVSVPIMHEEKALGILLLADKKDGYSPRDMGIMEKISRHISDRIYGILETEKLKEIEKKMAENAMNAQKMESLGALAGGIAHDFNNLLLGIMANLSFVKEKARDKELLKSIDDAEIYLDGAARLARQFIVFSKGGAPVKERVESAPFLNSVFSLGTRGFKCRVDVRLEPGLRAMKIDRGQMTQMFTNITINAMQALKKSRSPLIKINAGNISLAKGEIPDLPPGRYLKISVADNGEGISAGNIKKIFQPFFTTREKGHGLGLYMAYFIAKKHGGIIEVKSERGEGSVFEVYLPSCEEKEDAQEKKVLAGETAGLNVLILDDEEIILNSMKRILGSMKFRVFTALTSAEAFKIVGKERIDIALLDLTLKGDITGGEVSRRIKKMDARVYTVASSGYSDDEVLSDYRRYGFDDILPKPYKMDSLKKIVAGYLAKKR